MYLFSCSIKQSEVCVKEPTQKQNDGKVNKTPISREMAISFEV